MRNAVASLALVVALLDVAPAFAAEPPAAEKARSEAAAKADPAPAPAPAADALTIAAVGDIMLGSTFPDGSVLPPEDGKGLLAEVAPILVAADLALGNLEGPLVDAGESRKCGGKKPGTCYAFRVPTRYGKHLADAGFDVMAMANNHGLDFGREGWDSSKKTLDALGIAHTGEVGDVARLTVKGRKVAVVGFATYPNMYDLRDLAAAKKLVEQLKAESDLVIVSFHGGAEGASKQRVPEGSEMFLGEDRGDLRTFARGVIDSGAALVVGHGPHVLRGMEIYKGRLIAYSLGNFATWEKMNLSGPLGLTGVLEVRLAADGAFLGGKFHPGRQVKPGGPRLDPEKAALDAVRKLSQEDFGRSAVIFADDGTMSAP